MTWLVALRLVTARPFAVPDESLLVADSCILKRQLLANVSIWFIDRGERLD